MFGQQLYFKSMLTVKMRACQKMLIGDGFTSDNAILQEKSHNFMVLRQLGPALVQGRKSRIRPFLTNTTTLQL
jgi:hypothetical protein